jgi:hydroxyacid-oxoacid transhydrogenase
MVHHDTAFELAAASIRFGPGVTREVGMDLADLGIGRVMVLTDPGLARLAPAQTVLQSLDDEGLSVELYDQVRIEPDDASVKELMSGNICRCGAYANIVAAIQQVRKSA